VVKGLVEAHHGTVSVDSAPGRALLHHRAAEGESRGMTAGPARAPHPPAAGRVQHRAAHPPTHSVGRRPPGAPDPERDADGRVRGRPVERGEVQEAFRVYERAADYPADPASASALYGPGARRWPREAARSYRAAHAAFSRLPSEYPQSRWESEARAWRAVLGDLLGARGRDRAGEDPLERLRRTDRTLERRH
jgi:hypothetical protein